jgi:hypothetical protein
VIRAQAGAAGMDLRRAMDLRRTMRRRRRWHTAAPRRAPEEDVSNKADFVGLSPRLLSIGLSP